MSEKMKLLITEIKESPWEKDGKKVIYYNCKAVGGTEYTTTDPQIKQYLNVEHEFDVNSKENSAGVLKHYINFPKAGGGGGKNYSGGRGYQISYKDSKPGVVLSAKTMVLSYCKDITIATINSPNYATKDKSPNPMEMVKSAFRELIPLLDLDKLPEGPEIKPQEPTGAVTAQPHALSDGKKTIIWRDMQKLNFRARDLIDFAGKQGIEIKYNPEEDRALVSQLSEEQGAKLINHLAQAVQDAEGEIPF